MVKHAPVRLVLFFFFSSRRRHTRFDCDWSSDVCSSDLYAHLTEALRAGLSQSGYDVGRNVAVEYRWANEQRDRLLALAAELIHKPVAVIVGNTEAAQAAKAAGTAVPIAFVTRADTGTGGVW